MKKLSLEEILEAIEDTRRKNSVIYPLYEVLFIILVAIICGTTSYAKIELFAILPLYCKPDSNADIKSVYLRYPPHHTTVCLRRLP